MRWIQSATSRRWTIALILATTMLVALVIGGPRLGLRVYTIAWGGSCDPGMAKALAGSLLFMTLEKTDEQQAQPFVPGWPEGYVLEAALDLPEGLPYAATPGLMDRLIPRRYKSRANLASEVQVFERHSADSRDLRLLNVKEFVLRVPEDLVGHTVNLRARYEDNELHLMSDCSGPIRIIAPCDQSDTARIIATQMYAAFLADSDLRVVEIADSMLAAGLSDAAAWQLAKTSAGVLRKYDKAIEYLDRLWEDFGVLFTPSSTPDPPRLSRGGPRDPQEQTFYQQQRSNLLQLKIEQEQQQPQR